MAYLKPQSPLQDKTSGDYFYPLTTADQILMDDGSRLSGAGLLTVDKYGADEGEAATVNADTLGGYNAEEYVRQALPLGVEFGGTGATNYKDAKKNLGIRAVARNLLDNSDFTNPVAQAGLGGMHGAFIYALDRWMYNGSAEHLSLNNGNGLSFAGEYVIFQKLPFNILTKTHTLAIWLTNGTFGCVKLSNSYVAVGNTGFTATHNAENIVYIHNGADGSFAQAPIKHVALYEGEYTADNLPVYQPKGYGVELVECMRYYQQSFSGNTAKTVVNSIISFAANTNTMQTVRFLVPMRTTPTITIYDVNTGTKNAVCDWATDASITGVGVSYQGKNSFVPSKSGGFTTGKSYGFHYTATADL